MKFVDLFETWPYVAVAICGAGLLIRSVQRAGRRKPRHHEDGAATLSAASNAVGLFGSRRLWRWSWLLLLAIHLLALVFPTGVLKWNANPARLYLLEGVTLLVGLASFGGWASAVWHQFSGRSISRAGGLADSVFLAALLLGVVSGLLSAVLYRWASSWGAATLTPYIRSVAAGQPRADLVTGLPFLVRLHVASAFAGFAVFPFTSLAPALLLPVHHVLKLAIRSIVWATTAIEHGMRAFNVAGLLWDDQDRIEKAQDARRLAARQNTGRGHDQVPPARTNLVLPEAGAPSKPSVGSSGP